MNDDKAIKAAEVVHFISAAHDEGTNKTVCGVGYAFPQRGNGWRVRDITCPDCDRIITDMVHDNFRAMTAPKGDV
jgi:hypothetical protein